MFKKVKLFFSYRKAIKKCQLELQQRFNIRIDKADRMYTVLNVPEELVGEAYSLKKSDIDRISETYIREYMGELSKFLNENNLQELYRLYDYQKVDKYSYLMVFGFSLFKSTKYYNWLYFGVIPISVLSVIIASILVFF